MNRNFRNKFGIKDAATTRKKQDDEVIDTKLDSSIDFLEDLKLKLESQIEFENKQTYELKNSMKDWEIEIDSVAQEIRKSNNPFPINQNLEKLESLVQQKQL